MGFWLSFNLIIIQIISFFQIERIQILDLYKRYKLIKDLMQSSVPRGQVPVERTLYQGVNYALTQKINSSGFDRADNTARKYG